MIKFLPFKIENYFQKLDLKIKKKDFNKRKDVSVVRNAEFKLPLVNAKFGDNGIMFFGCEDDFDSAEMCIDIVQNGAIATGKVYAQPQKTGVLWDAYLVKPLFDKISVELLLYLTKCLEKSIQEKFNYDNKATWDRVKNEYVYLPSSDGETPDISYMESRIRELEEYLLVSGLNDYNLTLNEKEVLNREVDYKEFSIGELFDVKSPIKRFNANNLKIYNVKIENSHKYIVRTAENNGIKGYIVEDKQYLSPANTISFGQDTATVFYQEEAYFTGDKIKILTFKHCVLNHRIANYIISNIRKSFAHFVWGQSSFNEEILKQIKIQLPIKNNEIDYSYMQLYIQAMEKLAIKDVVDYKDLFIEKTKKLIN